jgi:hypothetical protein
MSFLFIGTTGDGAGHSLLTWAMARRLAERGLRVGFMKPFGTYPVNVGGIWTDKDALLFKEALHLQEPFDRICPYLVWEKEWRHEKAEGILKQIKSIAQELSRGKDMLIVMGSRHVFFDDVSHAVSDFLLCTALDAELLLVNRFVKTTESVYSILSVSSLFKGRMAGVILNRVPEEDLEIIRDQMIPSLSQKGIPIIIPLREDPLLSFRSLGEIREVLGGEFLCGLDDLEQPVGGMTVGSTDLDGDLLLLRRVYGKVILLRPSVSETEGAVPPAQRPIAGIILTGGRSPVPRLLEAARQAHIPLMVVKRDAFWVMERIEQHTPALSHGDETKVRRFTELLDRGGAFDRLLDALGIKPS